MRAEDGPDGNHPRAKSEETSCAGGSGEFGRVMPVSDSRRCIPTANPAAEVPADVEGLPRPRGILTFPANFTLVVAINPWACRVGIGKWNWNACCASPE